MTWKHITGGTSTTADAPSSALLSITRDEGIFIVSDLFGTHGSGPNLEVALLDWVSAMRDTVAVLKSERLAPELRRMFDYYERELL